MALADGKESQTALADRVHAVLSAAERAADAIREDAERAAEAIRTDAEEAARRRLRAAEEEAERREADARERAEEALRERLEPALRLGEQLAARGGDLLRRLEDAEALRRATEPLLEEVEASTRAIASMLEAPRASPFGGYERARIRALELAMAGRTRGEVERELVGGIGPEDPQSVLDDIFGPGSASSTRIPWSEASEAARGDAAGS